MKILFIGGTGVISTAVSRLAVAKGLDLYHLNRGKRQANIPGVKTIIADIHQPENLRAALQGEKFDVVVDWIAYTPADIERDLALFQGEVKQFIFISSASAYQKPPTHYIVTESTPLHNPYWEYSRNKILAEARLMQAYREENFPVTIVRPSYTYEFNIPNAIGGWLCYTLASRLKKGLPVIVHGDGTSLEVLTHAEDFARGFLGLLGNSQALGHPFHITSDEALTWRQIYETIGEALGVEANIVYVPSGFIARVVPSFYGSLIGDKSWSLVYDNSKIKTFVPGYQAVIPFREGIRRALAWYDADDSRKRVDEAVNADIERILAAYGGR
jgi:nucleoside-diphosphate-sugar epimerase